MQESFLDDITPEERARLLRYCARVTADRDTAEDLVQQTLLEAWQHAARIATPELRGPWLLGVARNICLRWLRSHGREAAHHVRLAGSADPLDEPCDQELSGPGDPLAEIERQDLVDLLDQALALLPAATRAVLVGKYIDDLPQAALAARLGVSEGAVEARLQRGKHALRGLLTTTFRDQLAAYGLVGPASGHWEATRIWCPNCGEHRLVAQLPPPPGNILFRCPGCDPDPTVPRTEYRLANAYFQRLIGGLFRPRAVLNRVAAWIATYYVPALETGQAPCTNCGQLLPLQIEQQIDPAKEPAPIYRLLVNCPVCGEGVSISFGGLVEALPPVQRFWHAHGRIRRLPVYEVETGGQAALVTRFAGVTNAAELTVVMTRDSFRLVSIEGAPAAEEER